MGKYTLMGFVAAVATLASTAAFAQRVDVTLEDRTLNRSIELHQFDGRWYAGGEPGHRYAIRLSNRTGERLLAVVSVDGVNVVSGETAAPHQSGYVLDPWQSTVINGWRKNMSEIAAFTFAPLPESYAARTGRPDDVGVIGVAVFQERRIVYAPPQELSREDGYYDRDRRGDAGATASRAPSAQPAPAAPYSEGMAEKSGRMDTQLGTGHGEREWSSARSTQFVRASSSPSEVNAIWYDSRRNLMAAGIIPSPQRRYVTGDSRPFPGFVPDPW
jgi:hypothetical protein